MAGMFYSLTEAAEKLGKTEDEVKQLAKEGTLREFRDGSNLLFKIVAASFLGSPELRKWMLGTGAVAMAAGIGVLLLWP